MRLICVEYLPAQANWSCMQRKPRCSFIFSKLRVLLRAYSLEGWLRVQVVNTPHRETISFCCFASDLCIFFLFCASEWYPNGKELLHAQCESCLVKWALWIPEAAGLECIYESRKSSLEGSLPLEEDGWSGAHSVPTAELSASAAVWV